MYVIICNYKYDVLYIIYILDAWKKTRDYMTYNTYSGCSGENLNKIEPRRQSTEWKLGKWRDVDSIGGEETLPSDLLWLANFQKEINKIDSSKNIKWTNRRKTEWELWLFGAERKFLEKYFPQGEINI